ncbi:ankyrin repeat-containing domain protein [Amanita rubescens]|nr:ankyrin repeat-containing domain protein [Amanita rubescens]
MVSLTQVLANHETGISIGKSHHKLHAYCTNSAIDRYKQWLAPPDPSTNLNNALKNHLSNTGSWLLNCPAYLEWKQRDNSFLWIYGISGSGKTILCSTLIQAIEKQTDSISSSLAYFFCDVSDINKRTARGLLCSLVLTLLTPQNQSGLQELFKKCKNGLQKPTDYDLYEVLRSYLSGFQDVYLFIDALDECANVEEVLDLVKLVNGWSIRSCHLLVTSRKELLIVNSLIQLMPTEVDLSCMPVNQDIGNYIDHMLFSAAELKTWNPSAKELIKVTLMEKGKGILHYIYSDRDMIYPNYLQIAALHGLIETAKQLMLQPVNTVGCMEALDGAASKGHINMVVLLLKKGKINVESDLYCNALEGASRRGENQVVRLLCEHGKHSDMHRQELLAEALYGAAHFGHKGIVKTVLKHGADLEAKAHAVISASAEGHIGIVELLLDSSINMNVYGRHMSDALCAAAHAGHEGVVRLLLEWGADPNIQGEDGQSPLHAASLEGFKNITQLLIDNGADVNMQGGSYGYAIWAAMSEGYNEIVELLLQYGASTSVHSGYSTEALVVACKCGNRKVVEQLLDEGVDANEGAYIVNQLLNEGVDANEEEYYTCIVNEDGVQYSHIPLHVASEYASEDIVRLLLEKGANVNIIGGYRWGTALQTGSFHGKKDSVQLLLEWGAYVNMLAGSSALIAASSGGHKPIVELLLKWGADVNLHCGLGDANDSALMIASFKGHKPIVELLLEWGADVNLHGGNCGSALIYASLWELNNNKSIVEMLLSQDADVNFCDKRHESALIKAASGGNKDIVKMLLQSGADVNIQGEKLGSALYAAANSDFYDTEIVQLLLAHGAKYLGPIDDTSYLRDQYNIASDDSDSMDSDSDSMMQNTDPDD